MTEQEYEAAKAVLNSGRTVEINGRTIESTAQLEALRSMEDSAVAAVADGDRGELISELRAVHEQEISKKDKQIAKLSSEIASLKAVRRQELGSQSGFNQPSTIAAPPAESRSKSLQPPENWFLLTFVQNPMFDEARRGRRKFLRVGPVARVIILLFFGLLYLWLCLEMLIDHADASTPFAYRELIALTLFIPSSIFGAISGERERATWDALMLTRLTPSQIIFGKLIWRFRVVVAIVILLLIPIGISRISPGVNAVPESRLINSQIVLISWSLLLCSFGLWISASTKRSITSLAIIIGSLVGVLLGLPVLYAMFANMLSHGMNLNNDQLFQLMYSLNPFTSMYSILNADTSTGIQLMLPGSDSGAMQTSIYLVVSGILVMLTFWRIIGLEKPIEGAG